MPAASRAARRGLWVSPASARRASKTNRPLSAFLVKNRAPERSACSRITTRNEADSPPAGETRRSPLVAGPTTARLTATAEAVDGISQRPATGKTRAAPAASAGPPEIPAGPRVSATRQGVTVKNVVGGGLMR